MNSKSKSSISLLHDLYDLNNQDQELKFDLYVQERKVKQLSLALNNLSMNHQQDFSWLQQNPQLVETLLEELLDKSMLVLDGINLDNESMKLSLSLMKNVREALGTVESLVNLEFEELN